MSHVFLVLNPSVFSVAFERVLLLWGDFLLLE